MDTKGSPDLILKDACGERTPSTKNALIVCVQSLRLGRGASKTEEIGEPKHHKYMFGVHSSPIFFIKFIAISSSHILV